MITSSLIIKQGEHLLHLSSDLLIVYKEQRPEIINIHKGSWYLTDVHRQKQRGLCPKGYSCPKQRMGQTVEGGKGKIRAESGKYG